MELSTLIAQNLEDDPQKLANLQRVLEAMEQSPGTGLGGTNYVFVRGDGTPEENAIELQAAYDLAKTMPRYLGPRDTITTYSYYKGQTYVDDSLSEHYYYRVLEDFVGTHDYNLNKVKSITETEALSTILTVVVAPGQYKFGETAFIVDTPYINIVSLTGNPDVILNSDEIEAGYQIGIGVNVTADNVYLKGLNCGSKTFIIAGNLDGLVCENCTGGDDSFGGGGGNASGVFTNCVGGSGSFGGYDGFALGTFTNCTGGDNSFGAFEASGTFTNCMGGNNSFGGDGFASGTFTNCTGGNYSFGRADTASDTFINCTGGDESFGGGSYGTIASTARLYYCRLTTGTFKTPEAGGKLVLCIDGNDAVVTTA